MFDLLSFLATPAGMTATALLAAAIILAWEWRIALLGLVLIQIAVATVVVQRHGMPAQWALVQIAVTCLGCIILALSQTHAAVFSRSLRQSGTWALRLLVVGLAFFGLRLIAVNWVMPELDGDTTRMLVWLALTGALILAFGENPLFAGVGLLLWCVVIQAVIGPLLGIPALVAMIGILELLLALACSYLILAEEAPESSAGQVISDVSFPVIVMTPSRANGSGSARREPHMPMWREALVRRIGAGTLPGPAAKETPAELPSTVQAEVAAEEEDEEP